MTSLTEHQSTKTIKLLLMGDSGAGKTGALTSLVNAGYELLIVDMDNGLDALVQFIRKVCPDKLSRVQFETCTDTFRASPSGPVLDGPPKSFSRAIELLEKWSDGRKTPDLEGTIVVLDSLTFFSRAALRYAKFMNSGPKVDGRMIYFHAQSYITGVLEFLRSSNFKPHTIVISHIDYEANDVGLFKGFPRSVGRALNDDIPAYFNSALLVECTGVPPRRLIRTAPTNLVLLKNPAPFKIPAELPLETGLADFFAAVKSGSHIAK